MASPTRVLPLVRLPPDDVPELNGQDVKIDGFMLPLDVGGEGVGAAVLNANPN